MIKNIKKSGAWKKVNIDHKLLSENNFDDLISFEELHDYELVNEKLEVPNKTNAVSKTEVEETVAKEPKKQGERKRKKSANLEEAVKKKSKLTKQVALNKSPKPQEPNGEADEEESDNEDADVPLVDMDGWADLYVPKPVLRALFDLGYTKPTPIQEASLPAAIRDRRDIVGAAETGSGKTLAFAIPIIHRILEKSARAAIEENNNDDDSQSADSDNETDNREKNQKSSERSLNALIVTPTRELAIQIKDHINAIIAHTEIKVGVVVGGLSIQKQQRILKRRPHIVVATPGRLWELIQQGEPYLNTVADVDCLVIDEADRMVEKGHFQELTGLFNMLKEDVDGKKKRRQTFVFSATLTLVHTAPQRLKTTKKKKVKQLTSADKLDALMEHIGLSSKPKVIDLSSKRGVVQTLNEVKVSCSMEEKDMYLYDVLLNMPGRTLVFCNSKDSVRRLAAVLSLLIQPAPLTLHADMHQKQRLKFLDRFAGNKNSVMLATDVAARGLDIKHIDTVVHYQVPTTCENYVHRSGRTARASQSGTSVLLVCPQEVASYQKILKTLNRDKDLPSYSIDMQNFVQLKERVTLARKIDQHAHRKKKVHLSNNWFQKAAQEMDLILDESLITKGDEEEERRGNDKVDALHAQLTSLLRQPLGAGQCRSKYPTQSGRLFQPGTTPNRTGVKKAKSNAKMSC